MGGFNSTLIPISEYLRCARAAVAGALPAEPAARRARRAVHPEAVARAGQDRALPQPPQRDQGGPGDRDVQ